MANALPPDVREVQPGLYRIDVRHTFPQHTCCYLFVNDKRAAVVDCGGKQGLSAILTTLAAVDVAVENVEWVVATHAHLDHAGCAGELLQLLPNAVFAAHPTTVKHLIDPADKLEPATRGLYGAEFADKYFGKLYPTPAARTHALTDGESLLVGENLLLNVVYTPGHAWHHLSIYAPQLSFIVAGDAYGVSYRELDRNGDCVIVPVMPPSQFNPESLETSIKKLRQLGAASVGLAHFDVVQDSDDLAERQIAAMHEWLAKARALFEDSPEKFYPRMQKYLAQWLIRQTDKKSIPTAEVRRCHRVDSNLTALGFEYYLKKENA